MLRQRPDFDGNSFYTESDWIGFILRDGFGTEENWFVNILRALNPIQPGFIARRVILPNNTQKQWRDVHNPLDELTFDPQSDILAEYHQQTYPGMMSKYYDNFRYASHYFEAFDGSWRMHLPCDEQADMREYKIWAGTSEVWLKIRPYFENLPRAEPPSSGPLMNAYLRNNVHLTDNPDIPRNVVAGMGPVRFAGDAGYGWLSN
jgi:hypothetical protein